MGLLAAQIFQLELLSCQIQSDPPDIELVVWSPQLVLRSFSGKERFIHNLHGLPRTPITSLIPITSMSIIMNNTNVTNLFILDTHAIATKGAQPDVMAQDFETRGG